MRTVDRWYSDPFTRPIRAQHTAASPSDAFSLTCCAMEIAKAIGFDPVDAGPLRNARLLEPLGYFNIQLGYVLGLGTNIGLKLVRAS